MGAAIRRRRTPRATLSQIERGVFHAINRHVRSVCHIGGQQAYRTGPSAADAERAIELNDEAFGYDTIVWMEAFLAPLFASDAKIALDGPAPTYVACHGP
jgi:hypothetical protein